MVRSILPHLFNISTDEYRVGDRVIINGDCSNVYRIVKMQPASKKHDPPECEESCGFFYCNHDNVDCETMVRLTGCLHKGFYFKKESQDDAEGTS